MFYCFIVVCLNALHSYGGNKSSAKPIVDNSSDLVTIHQFLVNVPNILTYYIVTILADPDACLVTGGYLVTLVIVGRCWSP